MADSTSRKGSGSQTGRPIQPGKVPNPEAKNPRAARIKHAGDCPNRRPRSVLEQAASVAGYDETVSLDDSSNVGATANQVLAAAPTWG